MVNSARTEEQFWQLGNPGRYHIVFYGIIFTFNFYIISNFVSVPTMTSITPNHRCKISGAYIKEFRQEQNDSSISFDDLHFDTCWVTLNKSSTKLPCTSWSYDMIDGNSVSSLVTQWDLVCDKKFFMMLSTSIFFVGVLIGATTLSSLPDRYGRRNVLLISLTVSVIINTGSLWSPNIYVYTALRFIFGIVVSTSHAGVYILCFEMAPLKHNTIITLLFAANLMLTMAVGALVGWIFMDWWKIQLVLTSPFLLALILAFFVMPESFRWLIVHRKYKELQDYLNKAARFNSVHPPDAKLLQTVQMEKSADENESETPATKKKISFKQIFRHAELRKRLILGCIISFTVMVSFYIAAINVGELSSHPYKLILMSSGFDLIPTIFAYPLLVRFGKRRLAMAGSLITVITSITYRFYNQIALMIVGKMFLMFTSSMIFILNVDIFPTVIRNTCNGITMSFGRVGGILGPQIVLWGVYTSPANPILVLGLLTFIAFFSIYLLPDMKSTHQPNTLEDLDIYRRRKKMNKRKEKVKTASPEEQDENLTTSMVDNQNFKDVDNV